MDYFRKNGHTVVPSSPVIPFDDPTILFTNAGMNQFKDIFTGRRKVDYKRAASCQKCIRAGGKHNDLDNVGFTGRHHTFFEMLGNFSFGDYFKEQAIHYAWEWVTKELELPVDRMYATVYEKDDRAFELWEKIAPQLKNGRILRFGKKDNYWSMGDMGPCGPCSEIHFDRGEKFGSGPNDMINGETDRFVEIWNLVFMQYDRQPNGETVPLPKPSVDTGAGLERIAAIMQNVDSNYGIDLFQRLIEAISEITGSTYKDNVSSHHVVADHLRALTFAIADGAGVSNEGQGYVLRRILRRAAMHGSFLQMKDPFLSKLVPIVVQEMGEVYPELVEKQQLVASVIRSEEESFARNLEQGTTRFGNVLVWNNARRGIGHEDALRFYENRREVIDLSLDERIDGNVIRGEFAFEMYDTYGFPFDVFEILAREHGFTVDGHGFEQAMERQRARSRTARLHSVDLVEAASAALAEMLKKPIPYTAFIDRQHQVSARLIDAIPLGDPKSKEPIVGLILDRTPFYAEAGGQISDMGTISEPSFEVTITEVHKIGGWYLHQGYVTKGTLKDVDNWKEKSGEVTAEIDADRRRDIMRNHTATHLAHAALRILLGKHVRQYGSYVGPERMRFDFSHHQPMTAEEISEVEEIANGEILKGTAVSTETMDIEAARSSGAMALFGEKYEDKVRVVSVGDFSKELCGGTHVDNVNQIGPFFITMETGVASGVRRIEAITGREAVRFMLEAKSFRRQAAAIAGRPEAEALEGLRQLREQNVALQKEVKKVKAEIFSKATVLVGKERKVGPITLLTHDFGDTDRDIMAGWIDNQKGSSKPVLAICVGKVDGKVTYMAAASSKAINEYKIDAGKISRELLPQFGGRGGGKPSFAQGSVAPGTVPQQLFEKAMSFIQRGES